MKKSKFVLRATLIAASFIGISYLCDRETQGFSLYRIQADLPYEPNWEVSPLPAEEEKLFLSSLDQPFYFLGAGLQSYAFGSADGKLVLKLFRHHRMRPESWIYHIPLLFHFSDHYRRWVNKRRGKLSRTFTSCVIAFEKLKEETGILYLHLNRSSHLGKTVCIHDNLGIAHSISLDSLSFAVQKRASPFYPHLEELIKRGELEKTKKALSSLLDIIASRCGKQIEDHDAYIYCNFGFIDEKAIEIDLGSFVLPGSPGKMRKEKAVELLELQFDCLETWLEEKEPSLATFFRQKRTNPF